MLLPPVVQGQPQALAAVPQPPIAPLFFPCDHPPSKAKPSVTTRRPTPVTTRRPRPSPSPRRRPPAPGDPLPRQELQVRADYQSRTSRSASPPLSFFRSYVLVVLRSNEPLIINSVLAVALSDEDALRCKVVTLVKSYAIDRELFVIQECEALPIDLRFYKVIRLGAFLSIL